MSYEPWMLAAIDQAGYNGIRNEHINAVEIDRSTFEAACRRCGVAPDSFTQEDLNKLECVMNAE